MTAVAAGWRSAWARMESIHEMEAGLGRVAAGWKFVCCIKGGDEKAGGVRVLYVWEGGEFYRGCLKFIESRMIV